MSLLLRRQLLPIIVEEVVHHLRLLLHLQLLLLLLPIYRHIGLILEGVVYLSGLFESRHFRRRFFSRLSLASYLVHLDLLHIVALASEHELLVQLVLLSEFNWGLLRDGASVLVFLELFHSVCVAEGVEGVLATTVGGGDIGYHCGLAVAGERVLQYLSEFAPSERSVFLV